MPVFPALTELADTYPNPSNAAFKIGIAKLHQATTGLLGTTGSAADARTALGIGNAITFRNLLINAGGWINQRAYVSATATTGAAQYTLDRWRVVTSGQNLTFTAAAPDATMTAPAGGVEQVIEGANVVGGVYVLSWTGTATATVNGAAVTNGGTTASLPANTNVVVRFSGGTVLRPQFEIGTVATPFERRQIGTELALCQRYFEAFPVGEIDFIGNNFQAGQLNSYVVPMKVPKRASPSFNNSWNFVNVGSLTVVVATRMMVLLNVTNNTAGQWRLTNAAIAAIDAEL